MALLAMTTNYVANIVETELRLIFYTDCSEPDLRVMVIHSFLSFIVLSNVYFLQKFKYMDILLTENGKYDSEIGTRVRELSSKTQESFVGDKEKIAEHMISILLYGIYKEQIGSKRNVVPQKDDENSMEDE